LRHGQACLTLEGNDRAHGPSEQDVAFCIRRKLHESSKPLQTLVMLYPIPPLEIAAMPEMRPLVGVIFLGEGLGAGRVSEYWATRACPGKRGTDHRSAQTAFTGVGGCGAASIKHHG